ncbi:MAG: hypothetical protein RLY93_13080 [Sumerlaeia bacterium]
MTAQPHRFLTSLFFAGGLLALAPPPASAGAILYIADPRTSAIYAVEEDSPGREPRIVSATIPIECESFAFINPSEALFIPPGRRSIVHYNMDFGNVEKVAESPESVTFLLVGVSRDGGTAYVLGDEATENWRHSFVLFKGQRQDGAWMFERLATDLNDFTGLNGLPDSFRFARQLHVFGGSVGLLRDWRIARSGIPYHRDEELAILGEAGVLSLTDFDFAQEQVMAVVTPEETLLVTRAGEIPYNEEIDASAVYFSPDGTVAEEVLNEDGSLRFLELVQHLPYSASHWADTGSLPISTITGDGLRIAQIPESGPATSELVYRRWGGPSTPKSSLADPTGALDIRERAPGLWFTTTPDLGAASIEALADFPEPRLLVQRGEGPAFADLLDLDIAPDGQLYVLDGGYDRPRVMRVDPISGDREEVVPALDRILPNHFTSAGQYVQRSNIAPFIDVTETGEIVLVATVQGEEFRFITIPADDPGTTPTVSPAIPMLGYPRSVDVATDGKYLVVANQTNENPLLLADREGNYENFAHAPISMTTQTLIRQPESPLSLAEATVEIEEDLRASHVLLRATIDLNDRAFRLPVQAIISGIDPDATLTFDLERMESSRDFRDYYAIFESIIPLPSRQLASGEVRYLQVTPPVPPGFETYMVLRDLALVPQFARKTAYATAGPGETYLLHETFPAQLVTYDPASQDVNPLTYDTAPFPEFDLNQTSDVVLSTDEGAVFLAQNGASHIARVDLASGAVDAFASGIPAAIRELSEYVLTSTSSHTRIAAGPAPAAATDGESPLPDLAYDFLESGHGWVPEEGPLGDLEGVELASDRGVLALRTTSNLSAFGFWDSGPRPLADPIVPEDFADVEAYILRARVMSDQMDSALVPRFRLRTLREGVQFGTDFAVDSSGAGAFSPTLTHARDYTVVIPAGGALPLFNFAFDVVNGGGVDAPRATLGLDRWEVDIARQGAFGPERLEREWTFEDGTQGWSSFTAFGPYFGPGAAWRDGVLVLSAKGDGGELGSPPQVVFRWWEPALADRVAIEPGRLYRADFTLGTDMPASSMVPTIRPRVNETGFRLSHTTVINASLIGDIGPSSAGAKTYSVYLAVPEGEGFDGGEQLVVALDEIFYFGTSTVRDAELYIENVRVVSFDWP